MTAVAADITDAWVKRYVRNQEAYVQILAGNPFHGAAENRMPEVSVSLELVEALRIAYAKGIDDDQVQAFASRAAMIAQRILDDGLLTSSDAQSSFPLNRAVLHRDYAYARALRKEPLDTIAIEQASHDLETWCAGYKKNDWDSQAQANFLSAVRLCLILGDVARARELLGIRKSFKWHKIEHELWRELLRQGGAARENLSLQTLYRTYFDRLRDPRVVPDVYMETDIVRFELAAIGDKYFVSNDGLIDWGRAIEAVAGRK